MSYRLKPPAPPGQKWVRDYVCDCGHTFTAEVNLWHPDTHLVGEAPAYCFRCGLAQQPASEAYLSDDD